MYHTWLGSHGWKIHFDDSYSSGEKLTPDFVINHSILLQSTPSLYDTVFKYSSPQIDHLGEVWRVYFKISSCKCMQWFKLIQILCDCKWKCPSRIVVAIIFCIHGRLIVVDLKYKNKRLFYQRNCKYLVLKLDFWMYILRMISYITLVLDKYFTLSKLMFQTHSINIGYLRSLCI